MSLRQIRLFSYALTLIFIACAVMVFKLSYAASASNEALKLTLNLRFINESLDFNVKNNILTRNFDVLGKDVQNFDGNLTELAKISSDARVAKFYDLTPEISRLRENFEKKIRVIDRSNFISAGIKTIVVGGKYEISRLGDAKGLKKLFFKLENFANSSDEHVEVLNQEIDALKERLQGDEVRLGILARASRVAALISSLNDIAKQNDELKTARAAENLYEGQLTQYARVVERLRVFEGVSFALFFILLAFVFYQTKKSADGLREIKLLKTAIENDHSAVVFCNDKSQILYVNKTFENVTGYKFSEVAGRNPNFLKSFAHQNDFYEDIKRAIKTAKVWQSDELISRAKNGELIHEKAKIVPFFFDGKLEGYIGLKFNRTKEVKMIEELALKNEQIKTQSLIDGLTGFGNYLALTQKLEGRGDGMIICMSVKNFKTMRFFYQTKVIDAMVKAVADTLRLCVQTTQMSAELFRFQDDAFYAWYYGDNVRRDISYIKEYFSFSKLEVEIDGRTENLPGLKIVLGVSTARDTPQTNRLMQAVLANRQAFNADTEVYYYQENDAIETQYYKNQIVTQMIEAALENDTVVVECQGIFDVQSGEKEAKFYEVLVRIMDQNGKIRYPGEFLQTAVQAQLYSQITKKVIERAFSLIERYPKYTFSINLSSSDIADGSIRELLEDKLRICTRPEHLCFEMLESEEMDDYEIINAFIRRVKGYGCKISIDDFGSGYSNYYRILELDVDNIKIDGSIIKKLPFDQNARVLVETIVNFASKQGYKVVAEFVSSPEILEQVKLFGIKYAQGFLLGKPQSMG